MHPFDLNNIDFDLSHVHEIERKLVNDGYVRVQFSEHHLPLHYDKIETMELFFIRIIEQLGGQCLEHSKDHDSIVWHVRPMHANPKDKTGKLARSQTFEEFSYHTDCSYEDNPPEYVGLFVLETDKLGGGEFEIIRLSDVLTHLPETTIEKLQKKQFRIHVPDEFRKDTHVDHINGPILLDRNRIRYRDEILSDEDSEEADQLRTAISKVHVYKPKLEKYTMILMNNQIYLHGRTKVLDPSRHLLRVRFNRLLPYSIFSVFDHAKLMQERLTFDSTLYDYFDQQHTNLHKIITSIVQQYDQSNGIGEKIRQTFNFDCKINHILTQLNCHRQNYRIGSFRPDVIFSHGNTFRMNGTHCFRPIMCEINARFPLNGCFASYGLFFNDHSNRCWQRFSRLPDMIINLCGFDTKKPIFILKGEEKGFDVYFFQQYWMKKYSQPCLFIKPERLAVKDDLLFDKEENYLIEQFILELTQEEILGLSNDILDVLVKNKELNYFNDLRTIFIVHDKRLFTLLSDEQFLYALSDTSAKDSLEFIPRTYTIGQLPVYFKDSILKNRHDWCVKPNLLGKGEGVTIGSDVTLSEWMNVIADPSHEQWIIQQYIPSVQYQSMNISATVHFFSDYCFNMGLIRLSEKKIVSMSNGGYLLRPYIHHNHVFSADDGCILTKDVLREKLLDLKESDKRWNRHVYVSTSGGRGGKSLFFLTDIDENLLQRKIFANMLIEHEIISHEDVCLNLFQGSNIYRAGDIMNDICYFANCTVLPMYSNAQNEYILEVIEYFQPNFLMGSPSRLMQLALYIEKESNKNIKFEKVYFACEPLDDVKRTYLARIFSCSIFIGAYGSAEAGPFAVQLPEHSSTKRFLYSKELVHLEVIDSKIFVTNLVRKRNQLIRFDSGDLGRIIPTDDNMKYGLMELYHSRKIISFEANELHSEDLDEIAKIIDIIEWQLVVDYIPNSTNHKLSLIFRYVKSQSTIDDVLAETILNYLREIFKYDLPQLHEEVDIQFESIGLEDLIRDKVSLKILKIIDRRM